MGGMKTALQPDQQLLIALARATTGANVHDVGEFLDYYHNACKKGLADKVALWERAFTAFLSGHITPLRKAVAEIRYAGRPPLYGNAEWWKQGG